MSVEESLIKFHPMHVDQLTNQLKRENGCIRIIQSELVIDFQLYGRFGSRVFVNDALTDQLSDQIRLLELAFALCQQCFGPRLIIVSFDLVEVQDSGLAVARHTDLITGQESRFGKLLPID